MSAGLHDTDRERGNYWNDRALTAEARVAELEAALRWAIETVKANPIDGPGFRESMQRAQDALKGKSAK